MMRRRPILTAIQAIHHNHAWWMRRLPMRRTQRGSLVVHAHTPFLLPFSLFAQAKRYAAAGLSPLPPHRFCRAFLACVKDPIRLWSGFPARSLWVPRYLSTYYWCCGVLRRACAFSGQIWILPSALLVLRQKTRALDAGRHWGVCWGCQPWCEALRDGANDARLGWAPV